MASRARLPLQLLLSRRPNPNRSRSRSDGLHTEPAYPPAYPPVVASLTAKSGAARRRQAEERVKEMCACPVEEKLRQVTRIQRMKFVVYPQSFARDADRWYQNFTKTAFIPGLPEAFTGEQEAAAGALPGIDDAALADVRALVQRVILQESWLATRRRAPVYREQERRVAPLVRNLVRELSVRVAVHNPVLLRSSLDISPAVNFYWRRGQRVIPRGHRRGRLEPTRFQIDDRPLCQIRIPQQLPQLVPLESSYDAHVPEVKCAPNLMPLFRRQYDNHIFTGAKLPDPACYGHTQFHLVPDRYHRDRMARRQQSDQVEVFLRANGLASLFAWTGAQAMYQGFWNHQDVTRPFVSQAVITDGRFFSFFCYQLNTVALSVETDANNPRKNLLWGTESLPLYERVEDGQVVGLNDHVLALLVRFLMKRP
ncbi:unnamed protein product [Ophioblennius macclurei]